MGVPSILCFVMMIVQEQINVVFIGSLNDPVLLAGIGLGNMLLNLFGNGILLGVNTALETLVSQAFGRQNLRECGLYLHRSMFVVCCLFVPIAVGLCYSELMLILVGIDE